MGKFIFFILILYFFSGCSAHRKTAREWHAETEEIVTANTTESSVEQAARLWVEEAMKDLEVETEVYTIVETYREDGTLLNREEKTERAAKRARERTKATEVDSCTTQTERTQDTHEERHTEEHGREHTEAGAEVKPLPSVWPFILFTMAGGVFVWVLKRHNDR